MPQLRQLRPQAVDDLADRADDVVRRPRRARIAVPGGQRRADGGAVHGVGFDRHDDAVDARLGGERRELARERRAGARVGGFGALAIPQDQRLRRRREARRERSRRAGVQAGARRDAVGLGRGRRDGDADAVGIVGCAAMGGGHRGDVVAAGVARLDEERHALIRRPGAVGDAAQRRRGERRGAHRQCRQAVGRRRLVGAVEVGRLVGQRRVGQHGGALCALAAGRDGDPDLRALDVEVVV